MKRWSWAGSRRAEALRARSGEMLRIVGSLASLALLAVIGTRAAGGRREAAVAAKPERPTLRVPFVEEFEIDGAGGATAWSRVEWTDLSRREGGTLEYFARIKVLWSRAGLHVLFSGSDELVTATFTEDFEDLWTEDVFEVFLWPDERDPLYFEYEISPLGRELPILVPQLEGQFLGWRPWHYEGARRVRKKTGVIGNRLESGAVVKGWTAEIFLPFDLLRPLRSVPPKAGQEWRANFYRVDHDRGEKTAWDWARVGASFHDLPRFGVLRFEGP